MGRLLLMLIMLAMLTFICWVVLRLLNKSQEMTHEEKRKSFDEDIEAVANKIKERG